MSSEGRMMGPMCTLCHVQLHVLRSYLVLLWPGVVIVSSINSTVPLTTGTPGIHREDRVLADLVLPHAFRDDKGPYDDANSEPYGDASADAPASAKPWDG